MRLPVPGPRDLLRLADRGYDAAEQAIALVPRMIDLLAQAETLVGRANAVIEDVDRTQKRAGATIARVDAVIDKAAAAVDRVDSVVADAGALIVRVAPVIADVETITGQAGQVVRSAEQLTATGQALLQEYTPALTRLAPMLQLLAETTSPTEIASVVALIDNLPALVAALEVDILPILHTLGTVAPDVRDLLDTTKEFNEILGSVPGLGRIKKRVEERQEQQDQLT